MAGESMTICRWLTRKYRKRYHKTCQCPETPATITAPSPARLVNKGVLGLSVWVDLIINKYAFGIPLNRQLQSYKQHGLDLAEGTLVCDRYSAYKKLAKDHPLIVAEVSGAWNWLLGFLLC